ncbi:MAG: sulfite exporter TauE/SafE family protein, partial [Planctomycetales bacterium]|nr:sulfite exporter TauE/SafE family protein [Planctomycetales bacterium]
MFIGAVLQSIIGFGMGVLTIPIFVWLGVRLDSAIGLLVPSVLFQTCFNCWQNRSDLPWKDVWFTYVLRLACLPIGVWVLATIADSRTLGRQILGVTVIGIIVSQIVTRRPHDAAGKPIAKWWIVPAATTSGFMAGLIGMGGPSLVLWVMRQEWTPRRQRCFLWLSFLLVVPIQGLLMLVKFGTPMLWT